MAIIHKATVTPSKMTLISTWLDSQSWAGQGSDENLGKYRFDDPEGEVGVEAFLLRRGARLLHVPLTYRGEPLHGYEEHLVGTLEHSTLGTRWVYDGTKDAVAVACFQRALAGEQAQAELEVWQEGRLLERRPQQVLVSSEPAETVNDADRLIPNGKMLLPRVLGAASEGRRRLRARWGDEQAVVAVLV
ncbi:hypothetical protein KGD83_08760 [Nocardiopsis akebiae]|uniref:Maltokinase N-terminal cap domain-containing protein n=1 Tax=Nocardiopsis akebiae TaxID=2831968 RepID=A0ABX8C824_9ACTN|nr:hypothetical protein [Nocardiopsis akebiae]QUX30579.1 hypothetical protein KGD83_08760 [Nocardiopsis akebiae]